MIKIEIHDNDGMGCDPYLGTGETLEEAVHDLVTQEGQMASIRFEHGYDVTLVGYTENGRCFISECARAENANKSAVREFMSCDPEDALALVRRMKAVLEQQDDIRSLEKKIMSMVTEHIKAHWAT